MRRFGNLRPEVPETVDCGSSDGLTVGVPAQEIGAQKLERPTLTWGTLKIALIKAEEAPGS
jgi:hypothetical protein